MRRLLGLLLIISLFAAVVPLHRSLYALTQTYPDDFRSYYIPDSAHMEVLSLGYKNFWADLIIIWSLLYYDYYNRDVRYTYLERTFNVITDLDPRYREAYVMGALFAFMGQKWDLLYRFEDKGLLALPKDTVLAYDAGTYALFCEKNSERAARYFTIGMERDPNRTLFKKLLAYSLEKSGDLQTSRQFWSDIYEENKEGKTPEEKYYRGVALRNLWDIKVTIDTEALKKAVDGYKSRHGRFPATLKALELEGFVKALPLDPDQKPYAYDAKDGSVSCVSHFDFKAAFGQW